MSRGSSKLYSNKVALIDKLHGLESINVQISLEPNSKKRQMLKANRSNHIKSIKSLISHLNSCGKLSDKETRSLLSLDLVSLKDFRARFKIGGL